MMKTSSMLTAFAVALTPVMACSTTGSERRIQGVEWVRSDGAPQEVVREAVNGDGVTKRQHQLPAQGELGIDYSTKTISIPVNERLIQQQERIELLDRVSLEEEVERVLVFETKETNICVGGAVAGMGVSLLVSTILFPPEPPGSCNINIARYGYPPNRCKIDSDGATKKEWIEAATNGLGIVAAGVFLGGTLLYAINGGTCTEKTDGAILNRERNKTGRTRYVKGEPYQRRVTLEPKLLEKNPINDGRIRVSWPQFGLDLEYAVSMGTAAVPFPESKYPYFSKEPDVDAVDISWIQPSCQAGVKEYVAEATKAAGLTMQVSTVSTDSRVESASGSYKIPMPHLPSREDIISFIVTKHTVPRLTPEKAAGNCFSLPGDIQAARQYFHDWSK